jgi:hypothetical protein
MPAMDTSPDAPTERLLAAISHADADRQAPLFKAHLERQLDALEQYDIEYFDFLADTVVLAQQRMQDLRLEVVELRLDDLENPRFNMRDLVLDVALLVVLELTVIMMPHMAAGAGVLLSAMAGVKGRSKIVRDTANFEIAETLFRHGETVRAVRDLELKNSEVATQLFDFQRKAQAASQAYSEAMAHRELIGMQEKLASKYPLKSRHASKLQQTKKISEQELKRAEDAVREAIDKRNFFLKKREEMIAELQDTNALLDTIKLQVSDENLVENINNGFKKRSELEEFWENAKGDALDTFKGRAAEEVGGFGQTARSGSLGSAPSALRTMNFSPSTIAGDYLQIFRQLRRESGIGFSRLRTMVRYIDDADLFKSPDIQMLAISTGESVRKAAVDMPEILNNRETLAHGMEFMFWHFWLAQSGYLDISARQTEPWAVSPPYYVHDTERSSDLPAQIVEGVLVQGTKLFFKYNETTKREVGFRSYYGPGIPMSLGFSEHITDYLYKTFSRTYLKEQSVNFPFPVSEEDWEALEAAFTMEKTVGLVFNNSERDRLMKTMAAINTYVFIDFYEHAKTRTAESVFNEQGKTYGAIMEPLPFDFDRTNLPQAVRDAMVKEQVDALKEHMDLDLDLRDFRETVALERHLDAGLANIDDYTALLEEDGVEATSLLADFFAYRIEREQQWVQEFLHRYDSPPPEGEVAIAVDPELIEGARQFVRYNPSVAQPIGEGLDNDIKQIGEF